MTGAQWAAAALRRHPEAKAYFRRRGDDGRIARTPVWLEGDRLVMADPNDGRVVVDVPADADGFSVVAAPRVNGRTVSSAALN